MVYQVAFSVLLVPLWIESTCFCFCIDMNLVVLAQQYLLFDISLMLSCFSVLSYVDFGYFREYVQEITWWKCSNCGSWEEENGKGKGKYVYYKRIGVRTFLSQSSIFVTPLRSCRRMLYIHRSPLLLFDAQCSIRRGVMSEGLGSLAARHPITWLLVVCTLRNFLCFSLAVGSWQTFLKQNAGRLQAAVVLYI